jgi:NADH:ubiquinone oxidoreductase subunit E
MDRVRVEICMGSSCHTRGNYHIAQLLTSFQHEEPRVEIVGSLCADQCSDGPIVRVNGRVLSKVDTASLRGAIEGALPAKPAKQESA